MEQRDILRVIFLLCVVYFQRFLCKIAEKRNKVTNLLQNLAKNCFFKFAPKHWSSVLFPDLTGFLSPSEGKKLKNAENDSRS